MEGDGVSLSVNMTWLLSTSSAPTMHSEVDARTTFKVTHATQAGVTVPLQPPFKQWLWIFTEQSLTRTVTHIPDSEPLINLL